MKRFEVRLPNDKRSEFVDARNSFVDSCGILRFYNDKPVAQFAQWLYYKDVTNPERTE